MDNLYYVHIIVFIISLILSFELTLIENAYVSISTNKIKKLENQTKDFKIINKLYNDPKVYSTILILDYFANSLTAISSSLIFYTLLGNKGIIIASILSPIIIITLGETVPKALGTQRSEKIILKHSNTLFLFNKISMPLVFIIESISKFFIKITGGDKNYKHPKMTEDELIDAVSLGMEEGILNKSESFIIENVIDFKDSLSKDIMTPRTDIIAIDANSSYKDIIKIIKEESFSRMPVYLDDIDNIIGILHVKDLILLDNNSCLKDNLNILKPTFYTFEYKPIGPLFNEMRHKKISVAIVTDEYGGTEGMITTEDMIEKIVGSIADEYDVEEDEDIIKINENEYLIDGSISLNDLNHYLNLDLESIESDSIAGYIIEKIDRFPKTGENILINNLNITISSSSKNRIEKLILKL